MAAGDSTDESFGLEQSWPSKRACNGKWCGVQLVLMVCREGHGNHRYHGLFSDTTLGHEPGRLLYLIVKIP